VIAFSWSGVLGDAVRVGPCDQVASPFPTPCFDYRGETVHETATKKHVHGAYQVQADEVAIRAGSKASIHGSGSGAIFADTCIMEL
jgi:hypothetical protein